MSDGVKITLVVLAMIVAICILWGVIVQTAINDSKRPRDNEGDDQ